MNDSYIHCQNCGGLHFRGEACFGSAEKLKKEREMLSQMSADEPRAERRARERRERKNKKHGLK